MDIKDFKDKVIKKISKNLEIKTNEKKHTHYEFWHEGKKVIETYCSHGSGGKEIYDPILSKIKRQLRLDNAGQLYELKDCSFDGDDYFNLLKQKNVISD